MNAPKASKSPASPHETAEDSQENEDGITFTNPRPANVVNVQVERMRNGVQMPEMENPLDAAFDLRANFEDIKSHTFTPGLRVLVPTGLKIALPPNTELQVRPRSGLANDHGIDVANSPGTVDPGYRGEIKVILENRGADTFTVDNGDRIAQAAIRPVLRPAFEEVEEVPEDTDRGEGGFGSTGV